MYSYKITDEVRLVNTVHDRAASYVNIPEHEARARRIAAEAGRWLTFATVRTTMKPAVLTAKTLDSACFSVAAGASHFAVPSKLVGVKAHQRALWQIVRDGYHIHDELETDTATTSGVRVSYGDTVLGDVQPKHVAWLRPLIPFGLTVHIARITGSETENRTLGVNVVFGHVAPAIAALSEALGTSGDGASGDGSVGIAPSIFPPPALPRRTATDGDGASVRLAAIPDPADVVLFRGIDGTARATVEHVAVHSPTGFDWGRLGAGPADLALAVITAVAGKDAAERHSAAFTTEVVARVPFAGGVLRASRVRAWIARQTA